MYNQEFKKRYEEEKRTYTTISKYGLTSVFNKTASFEEELCKDVSNFTTYEIINMYKTLDFKTLDYLAITNSSLVGYTQWCIEQGLVKDFQNHYLEIDRQTMQSVLNIVATKNKIVTREQVLMWCGQLPNPSDAFCLLGVFEGVKGSGYLELTYAKVGDFKDNEFTSYEGRIIKVSDELIQYAKESDVTLEYHSISNTMSKKATLVDNGRVLKGYPTFRGEETPAILRRRIQSRLARIFEYLHINDWMTGYDIRVSGIIHMIKKRSKELDLSYEQYIRGQGIKEIKEQYDYRLVPSTFLMKYEEYLA